MLEKGFFNYFPRRHLFREFFRVPLLEGRGFWFWVLSGLMAAFLPPYVFF